MCAYVLERREVSKVSIMSMLTYRAYMVSYFCLFLPTKKGVPKVSYVHAHKQAIHG